MAKEKSREKMELPLDETSPVSNTQPPVNPSLVPLIRNVEEEDVALIWNLTATVIMSTIIATTLSFTLILLPIFNGHIGHTSRVL
jgi:hypothetical protein